MSIKLMQREQLIEELEESLQNHIEQIDSARNEIIELEERRAVLCVADQKTRSGMAKLIIHDMITEIDKRTEALNEVVRSSNSNKEHFIEVLRVVKEAISELDK